MSLHVGPLQSLLCESCSHSCLLYLVAHMPQHLARNLVPSSCSHMLSQLVPAWSDIPTCAFVERNYWSKSPNMHPILAPFHHQTRTTRLGPDQHTPPLGLQPRTALPPKCAGDSRRSPLDKTKLFKLNLKSKTRHVQPSAYALHRAASWSACRPNYPESRCRTLNTHPQQSSHACSGTRWSCSSSSAVS